MDSESINLGSNPSPAAEPYSVNTDRVFWFICQKFLLIYKTYNDWIIRRTWIRTGFYLKIAYGFLKTCYADRTVSKTGYFVYCNGNADKEEFDGKLEFDIKIIPYTGDASWVEKTIQDAIDCLKSDRLPEPGLDCDYCKYREAVKEFENNI